MKHVLAKPGRNGQWSAFLRAEGIAKATADRLVKKHEETSGPQPSLVTEEVSDPTEADVERLFHSLIPKLRSQLTTAWSAYQFVLRVVGSFGLPCDMQADGILVLNPVGQSSGAVPDAAAAGQAAGTASAPGAAPQPADEVPATTEEPAAETAAATPAAEALAGDGDNYVGAVA